MVNIVIHTGLLFTRRHVLPSNKPLSAICKENITLSEKEKQILSQVDIVVQEPDFLHPHYQMILQDKTMISRLAALGIPVNPYTPDDYHELKELWDLGCYGIITNRPDILLKIRDESGIIN